MRLSKTTRRITKTLGWSLAVIVTYCIVHVLLAVYPQPLFRHHRAYKNFTVYMRQEVPAEITEVLDRAESLLSAGQLNDADARHEIFIFNSYRMSRWLFVRNIHFGCNMWTGDSFITNADVVNDIATCKMLGPNDTRRRTLSESIAHEIAHKQLRNHVGFWAERAIPSWIKEGYCEYVAEGCPIDPRLGLSLLESEPPGWVPGLDNFRHRLMFEYLINAQRMTIDEIIRWQPDYERVRNAVLAGLRDDEQAFLLRIKSSILTVKPGQSGS